MDFSVSSDIVVELLEVAINLILYTREIYPQSVFQRRKKYSIPVQMCIHPGLRSYISECVGSIRPVLEKGEVEKVIVAVLSTEGVPVEKFVFEIVQQPTKPHDIKQDPQLLRMEEALRAFCLKLSISDSLLQPLPPGCSFAVHIQVPEHVPTSLSTEPQHQEFPWVEAEKEQTEVHDPHIVPLKTLRTEVCKMQLYVEESSNKQGSND
ncbi:mitotic spindle assembly checkpoint protein MAD2B-like [Homarus americanus]|uniref:mitotic spindle assembly checkpoint protein MAD2B-like n=1 Tax=Homarus americanus TaxID=6706 RepID=UPI001C454000|nr:mitotic spindle assembly checkpoint protein MAD2B-like [Homarus americanus]